MNNEINEMANIIEQARERAGNTAGSMNKGFGMWYATALYNDGCRILDDHAIMVLRKAKGIEERIRKETARNILQVLLQYGDRDEALRRHILDIADEYCVEV